MHLFFDTETTGLPKDYKAKVSDLDNWPRLVQLAYQLYNEDQKIVIEGNVLAHPDGWHISKGALDTHGISEEKCREEGKKISSILNNFRVALNASKTLVAHNMNYDYAVLGAEFIRHTGKNPLKEKQLICTMLDTVNYCQLPNRNGYGGYKWPKLAELHNILFGCEMENAHDALGDVSAMARCFFALEEKGFKFNPVCPIKNKAL
jgi:DNA polymerase III epsilon subunit-like protein